jgi:hypothetical protein
MIARLADVHAECHGVCLLYRCDAILRIRKHATISHDHKKYFITFSVTADASSAIIICCHFAACPPEGYRLRRIVTASCALHACLPPAALIAIMQVWIDEHVLSRRS